MKSSPHKRPSSGGVQLVQALGTLAFLVGIYSWSMTFDNNPVNLRTPPQKPAILTSKYWNDNLGYGFQTNAGDKYQATTASGVDQVTIRSGDGEVYRDDNVRVSFYSGTSIEDIEKNHGTNKARTYSRLPNGIAVIEGNLDSPRAKLVLTTLHAR